MKKNRVFLRGPTLSALGRAVVPSKPWPCATCVTDKSAVTALSHPKRSPPPKEAASTLVNVPKDGARCKPDRVQAWSPLPQGHARIFFVPRRHCCGLSIGADCTVFQAGAAPSARSAAVVSRRLRKRGCMAPVPLEPSAQDEEEPRISPWAYAQRAGQGRRAQQTLALRDLRYGQIS